MAVEAYLYFDGRCEEALDFYCRVLGAHVRFVMRFRDAPPGPMPGPVPPGWEDKIMHANVVLGGSQFMASDGMPGHTSDGHSGFSMAISEPIAAEGKRVFEALADGGQIIVPYGPTFWSCGFGKLTDRFGIPWMVNAEH